MKMIPVCSQVPCWRREFSIVKNRFCHRLKSSRQKTALIFPKNDDILILNFKENTLMFNVSEQFTQRLEWRLKSQQMSLTWSIHWCRGRERLAFLELVVPRASYGDSNVRLGAGEPRKCTWCSLVSIIVTENGKASNKIGLEITLNYLYFWIWSITNRPRPITGAIDKFFALDGTHGRLHSRHRPVLHYHCVERTVLKYANTGPKS